MKEAFEKKAKGLLEPDVIPKSPRELWILAGTCFYVIYALGICPARFRDFFRLLGRVASALNGAGRDDPRWAAPLLFNEHELNAIRTIKMNTSQYPTAIFEPTSEPERYLFTDASNEALGAVYLVGDRIATWSRRWSQEEQDLPINSKEVIAAKEGFFCFIPLKCRKVTLLGVDNTVAFFDLVNGASRCHIANQCVLEIRTRWRLGLIWIPTELMPADGPSRMVEDDDILEKIRLILNEAKRYVYLPKLV